MTMCNKEYHNPQKREKANQKRARQKEYLDKKVMQTERKRPFIYAYREDFCNGDFDAILTEAEKSRLIFIILQKVKIS